MEQRLDRIESLVGQLIGMVASVIKEQHEMKEGISGIKADIVDIKVDIVDMKADIVDMKADIVDMKADIVDMKADIADIQTTVGSIDTRLHVVEEWGEKEREVRNYQLDKVAEHDREIHAIKAKLIRT